MNKVIDINEVSTYPIELVNFCNEKKEALINSFKDNYLYFESDLYNFVNFMLKDYEFKCIHVSNIHDIDSIKKKWNFKTNSCTK